MKVTNFSHSNAYGLLATARLSSGKWLNVTLIAGAFLRNERSRGFFDFPFDRTRLTGKERHIDRKKNAFRPSTKGIISIKKMHSVHQRKVSSPAKKCIPSINEMHYVHQRKVSSP